MARDLNRWTGIGRLGKDVELRYLPNGDAVANFSIACGDTWTDKQSGEKKESTEWVNLVAFKKLAEVCGQYLKKGSKVYAEGKFTTRKWEKDGQTHYSSEIRLDNMQMLDGKPASEAPARAQRQPAAAAADVPFVDDDIDSVPF